MIKILTEKFSKILLVLGLLLLGIGVIIFLWNDINFNLSSKINSEKIAQFGDFIGGLIGSIWALAGVILFYVALTEQRNDFKTNKQVLEAQTKALEQQIIEFELQRVELSETRKIYKIQSDTLKSQQFDSTFFKLISLHNEIVGSLAYRDLGSKYYKKRDCFKGYLNDIFLRQVLNGKNYFGINCLENPDDYIYNFQYDSIATSVEHYHKNLYQIISFVKNRGIDGDKKQYSNFIRSQLSRAELKILFLHGLSNYGINKFKPLIEEFAMLEHLQIDDEMEKAMHLYSITAFGSNDTLKMRHKKSSEQYQYLEYDTFSTTKKI